jgi:hypothetical protein
MRPAVSVEAVRVQDVQRVSPAWLRPVAFGVVLCLHLALLVGVPWPTGTTIARPPPFEIQVIPGAEPAQLLVPLDSDPVVEVKPANAVTVDVQPEEAQPLSQAFRARIRNQIPAGRSCVSRATDGGIVAACRAAVDSGGPSRPANARGPGRGRVGRTGRSTGPRPAAGRRATSGGI